MKTLAQQHDCLLLDLDGTVFRGHAPTPGAVQTLASVECRALFVTNNASRSANEVAAHLCELGFSAVTDDVVTSAQSAARMLAARLPAGAKVLVVGTDALAAEVEAHGGQLAGLGARDTLRTEMGYPLHGHELSLAISPLQARCGWAVGWSKGAFWGRDALLAEKQAGPARLLRGLRAVGRGVPRAEMVVLVGSTPVGVTTSGTFSPSLNVGIALALIDSAAGISDGDTVSVDVRGRPLQCEVVKPPFVDVKTR